MSNSSGIAAVTFPLAFSSACLKISPFINGKTGIQAYSIVSGNESVTGANIYCAISYTAGVAASGLSVAYISIGK